MPPTVQDWATWKTFFIVLTAFLLVDKGRCPSVLGGPNELPAEYQEGVPSAIAGLQSGQTLELGPEDVLLDATLYVKASNVIIRGVVGKTTVRCPAKGGAFVVTGKNVTFERLVVRGCCNFSAVAIEETNNALVQDYNYRRRYRRREISTRSVIIKGCLFCENRAEKGSAVHAVNRATVEIEGSVFENSVAKGAGGFIYVESSSNLIEHSSFKHGSSYRGGAVYSSGGSVSFRNCSFRGNSATDGGAVETVRGRMSFDDCFFHENSADGGGAVFNGDGIMSFADCFFDGNSATHGGAVETSDGFMYFADCSFCENSAHDKGGAVFSDAGSVQCSNCSFHKNSADGGGAVFINGEGVADFRFCSFDKNKAERDGGAIAVLSAHDSKDVGFIRIDQSVLKDNSARIGGAVWISASTLTIRDCLFAHNNATHFGGAIAVKSSPFVGIAGDVSFSRNAAQRGGACSFTEGTNLTFNSSDGIITFSRNSGYQGGGLFCLRCSKIHVHCRGQLVGQVWRRQPHEEEQLLRLGTAGGTGVERTATRGRTAVTVDDMTSRRRVETGV